MHTYKHTYTYICVMCINRDLKVCQLRCRQSRASPAVSTGQLRSRCRRPARCSAATRKSGPSAWSQILKSTLYILLHSTYTTALTFENFCQGALLAHSLRVCKDASPHAHTLASLSFEAVVVPPASFASNSRKPPPHSGPALGGKEAAPGAEAPPGGKGGNAGASASLTTSPRASSTYRKSPRNLGTPLLGDLQQWMPPDPSHTAANSKNGAGDWTLRAIRRAKHVNTAPILARPHAGSSVAGFSGRGWGASGSGLDSLLPGNSGARSPLRRRAMHAKAAASSFSSRPDTGGAPRGSDLTSGSQSLTGISRVADPARHARRMRAVKAMHEGVAKFYDALLDKSWIPWQTKRPRCPSMVLVLHVEMRYGERCLNISHDASKYEALVRKMHELVQTSDSLGTYRLVCNVPEILIHTHSSPTPRLGAFEVSAVWLAGHKVLRQVTLFSKLSTGLFPAVEGLIEALEDIVASASRYGFKKTKVFYILTLYRTCTRPMTFEKLA
jgi:hypothetical protein